MIDKFQLLAAIGRLMRQHEVASLEELIAFLQDVALEVK